MENADLYGFACPRVWAWLPETCIHAACDSYGGRMVQSKPRDSIVTKGEVVAVDSILCCVYVGCLSSTSISGIYLLSVLTMKKFVLLVVIFAALAVLLVMTISCIRYSMLESYAQKKFHAEEWQRILVLGDSHAECGFVEDRDFQIKMLTYHSTPLNVSLMRLKELERRGGLENIKACVVNFWYANANGHITVKAQQESVWRMMPYSLRYRKFIPLRDKDLYGYLIKQIVGHPENLPPVVTDSSKRKECILFQNRDSDWRNDNVNKAITRHYGWKNKSTGKIICDPDEYYNTVIGEMKEICDKHEIKLIFYSAPLTKEYNDKVPQWAKQNLKERAEWLEGMGIAYYDYINRGTTDMFADADHLCLAGARKFTRMFYEEVLVGLLR